MEFTTTRNGTWLQVWHRATYDPDGGFNIHLPLTCIVCTGITYNAEAHF